MTSEYFVIKGAKALAIPTKLGQKMEIKDGSGSELVWKSLDSNGKEWFSASFDLMGFDCIKTTDDEIAAYLRKYLRAACQDNSDFLSKWKKYRVTTSLEFPRTWGLGSSSTMIHCLAEWAEANPFLMYFNVEDGSGYDIACAGADGPIMYTLSDDRLNFEECDFNPDFKDNLFFLPLGNKVNSAKAVRNFLKKKVSKSEIKEISSLTEKICAAKSITEFNKLIVQHEDIVSKVLDVQTVKQTHFADFWGEVKSLGTWGGDMVLISSTKSASETADYFKSKGFTDIISYQDLVL